jgi:hypothetical protein
MTSRKFVRPGAAKALLTGVALSVCFLVASDANAMPLERLGETEVVQQIQRYCAVSWRNVNVPRVDWSDCSQQVFAELLERIRPSDFQKAVASAQSAERRQLNRAIWRIAKRQSRAARRGAACGALHRQSLGRESNHDVDLIEDVLAVAERELSARQNCIVKMTAQGYSVGEMARCLGIATTRVSDEKYRALMRLRVLFATG